VCERNFSCDECIDRHLSYFCIHEIHALDKGTVVADPFVNGRQEVAGASVGLANKNEIRSQHIIDNAAEGYELRIVAKTKIAPHVSAGRSFECLTDWSASRSGHYRACDHCKMIANLAAQRGADLADGRNHMCSGKTPITTGGGWHSDKSYLAR